MPQRITPAALLFLLTLFEHHRVVATRGGHTGYSQIRVLCEELRQIVGKLFFSATLEEVDLPARLPRQAVVGVRSDHRAIFQREQ